MQAPCTAERERARTSIVHDMDAVNLRDVHAEEVIPQNNEMNRNRPRIPPLTPLVPSPQRSESENTNRPTNNRESVPPTINSRVDRHARLVIHDGSFVLADGIRNAGRILERYGTNSTSIAKSSIPTTDSEQDRRGGDAEDALTSTRHPVSNNASNRTDEDELDDVLSEVARHVATHSRENRTSRNLVPNRNTVNDQPVMPSAYYAFRRRFIRPRIARERIRRVYNTSETRPGSIPIRQVGPFPNRSDEFRIPFHIETNGSQLVPESPMAPTPDMIRGAINSMDHDETPDDGDNMSLLTDGVRNDIANDIVTELVEDWPSGVDYFRSVRQRLASRNRVEVPDQVEKFRCDVCMNDTPLKDAVKLGQCHNRYCATCTSSYLNITVLNSRSFPIRCPDTSCGEQLDTWKCADFLDKRGVEGGEKLRTLALLKTISKLAYCSNPRCNTPFDYIKDDDGNAAEGATKKICTHVTCPLCKVKTCVMCNTQFHEGLTCDEAKLNDPLNELKRERQWKHCPECKTLIERTVGCDHMVCRCGAEFCYKCGASAAPECDCMSEEGNAY